MANIGEQQHGCSPPLLLMCPILPLQSPLTGRPINQSTPPRRPILNIHVMLLVRTLYMFCSVAIAESAKENVQVHILPCS